MHLKWLSQIRDGRDDLASDLCKRIGWFVNILKLETQTSHELDEFL
jgi:hypothetical protein